MRHVVEALGLGGRFLQRPELHRERARTGLQQVRQIEMIGAEAHAVLAQRRARFLIEAFHLLGDARALQHAERFGELERDAARDAGDVFRAGQRQQRPEQLLDVRLDPEVEPRLHGVARRAGEMLVRENAHARAQHVVARRELADRLAEPADAAVGREHELLVAGMGELCGARVDLAGERLLRGGAQRLAFRTRGRGIGCELEAREPPDRVALDDHFAGFW